MPDAPATGFRLAPQYGAAARQLGLDIDTIFDHPDIHDWRSIADRRNGTLDFAGADGRPARWHVKRYTAVRRRGGAPTPAELEVRGIELLRARDIPTVPLVGWGVARDGRSFVLIDDLAGYRPCDKLLFAGLPFDAVLAPTADLAARLHRSGLHHRDLYLCHFFAKIEAEQVTDLRLIDIARVKPLPTWLRRRWVVKDLAQFWYSSLKHDQIAEDHRARWLARYAERADVGADAAKLLPAIRRKVAWIGRHDVRLNRAQPNRNVSIPTVGPGEGTTLRNDQ